MVPLFVFCRRMTLKRLFTFKKLVINKKYDEKGFTLVEVLVAMTIFAIGLLAIAGMQITAIKTNSSANTRTVQTDIAASILEEVLDLDIAAPGLAAGNHNWVFIDDNDTVVSGGTYLADYTVSLNTPVTNIIQVVLNVQQANGLRRTYSVTGFKGTL